MRIGSCRWGDAACHTGIDVPSWIGGAIPDANLAVGCEPVAGLSVAADQVCWAPGVPDSIVNVAPVAIEASGESTDDTWR